MIPHLATMAVTRMVLDRHDIRARKRYGQNFLIREEAVEEILAAANIGEEDTVLEIGPGIGTMTSYLSARAKRVISVEIDKSLQPVLEDTLQGADNITIVWEDILKVDLQKLHETYADGRKMKVVANLPYYVTTPILMELLQYGDLFSSITLMVQKEVAERICADPGTKEYGAITLGVAYYAAPHILAVVPSGAFFPRPNVDSAILHLKAHETPPVDADRECLFELIRAAFGQRRKTLANAIAHATAGKPTALSREEVVKALEKMGLSGDIRGEKLGLPEFAMLTELCYTK